VTSPVGADGRGDPQALLDGLAERLPAALPPAVADVAVEVERDRSMGDRLAGRPGRVALVRLRGPEQVLTLRLDGRRLVAEALREVRGVVIARRAPALGEWLDLAAGQLHALAADAAADTSAVTRSLAALGVTGPAADLAVDPADVAGGLRALPLRLPGRVPPEAVAAVERIAGLLVETLPRVAGSFEQDHLVRRTATDYLPGTLQAYAALPPQWAQTHRLPGGRTAAQALLDQLDVLERAVRGMHDGAVGADASALLANGRFLEDRFAVSELRLPEQ
jgi:hypothetical protein